MKKVLTASVLSVGLMFSTCANAFDARPEGNKVKLNFPYDADSKTMLVVVREGGSINNNNDIYALKLAGSDDEGNVDIEIVMPDSRISDASGYEVYISKNGTSNKIGSFIYASGTVKNTFLTNEINANITSESNLATLIDNAANEDMLTAIGFDLDEYLNLSPENQEKARTMMVDYAGGSLADPDTAAKYFNRSVATVMANNDSADMSVLSGCDLSFEGEKYEDLDSSKQDWIGKSVVANKPYTSPAQLVDDSGIDIYEKANMLYKVNNARFNQIEGILNTYATMMGIDSSVEYTKYKNLASKNSANDKLVDLLTRTPAYTVAELLNRISEATGNGSGNPVIGGGSGSASSGNISTGVISPSIPEKEQPEPEPIFDDLGTVQWAVTAIEKMAKAGIVAGDGNKMFRPNDAMTREEYVKMIVCAAGMYDANAKCDFADVPEGAWYYSYVASAYNNGLVFGKSDTEFGIGSLLTRQDMAVIAARAAEKIRPIDAIREGVVFADEASISEYAKESIDKLYRAGIINGIDAYNFAPAGQATRAQGALIICNLFLK